MLKIFSLINIVFAMMSCSDSGNPKQTAPGLPLIVATTTHLADLARQIGGNAIQVEALMRPGVDPHSYRATAHDITLIHQADLVLFHGLSLEGKLSRVLEDDQATQRIHFSPCNLLSQNRLILTSEANDLVDPHLWFSPTLWLECGLYLRDKLR